MLRCVSVQLDPIDKFLPTVDKNDELYPERLKGLETANAGITLMVVSSLKLLSDRNILTVADKERLLRHLRKSLPGIVSRLPAPSADDTDRQLKNLLEDQSLIDLRPAIRTLSDEIAAAVGKRRAE